MKIHWILLAAGLSRRFGENKLLYPVDGKKLYRYSLERMAALAEERQERLVVVTSHEAIRKELAGEKAEVVWNPMAETGIASSIHCAIRHLGIAEDVAYLFSVADQPFLRREDLGAFIEGFLRSSKAMGCMAHQEVWGNPAIFSGKYVKRLLSLEGDQGGKKILLESPEQVFVFDCEQEKAFYDIDEKKDLREF